MFFESGLLSNRGPSTIFSVYIRPKTTQRRAPLSSIQKSWFRSLRERLGKRYQLRTSGLDAGKHAIFRLGRTSNPVRILREFDHIARAIDGKTRATPVNTRRRHNNTPRRRDWNLAAISSALVTSDGPWRLHGVSFFRDTRCVKGSINHIVSASVRLMIRNPGGGFGASLCFWSKGRGRSRALDQWDWFHQARRDLERKGYENYELQKDPVMAFFQRFVPTLRPAPVMRELCHMQRILERSRRNTRPVKL